MSAKDRNTTNSVLPISMDRPAMPVAPRTKATIAKIKKAKAARIILFSVLLRLSQIVDCNIAAVMFDRSIRFRRQAVLRKRFTRGKCSQRRGKITRRKIFLLSDRCNYLQSVALLLQITVLHLKRNL